MTDLIVLNEEVKKQLANPEVQKALLETTFKGLSVPVMQQAILEGTMRGFTFKDFLEKNIYAIPFAGKYSLVTSIDYARKIGSRSGVIGVSIPTYIMDGEVVVSCEITVKKLVSGHIGEFSALVYFKEFTTGKNLWVSKSRLMISKVAEMHALRKACPEELSQTYLEEEVERETVKEVVIDFTAHKTTLNEAKTKEEQRSIWSAMPIQAKLELKKDEKFMAEMKAKFEVKQILSDEEMENITA